MIKKQKKEWYFILIIIILMVTLHAATAKELNIKLDDLCRLRIYNNTDDLTTHDLTDTYNITSCNGANWNRQITIQTDTDNNENNALCNTLTNHHNETAKKYADCRHDLGQNQEQLQQEREEKNHAEQQRKDVEEATTTLKQDHTACTQDRDKSAQNEQNAQNEKESCQALLKEEEQKLQPTSAMIIGIIIGILIMLAYNEYRRRTPLQGMRPRYDNIGP